jgi:hypothetical protein
MNIWSIARPVLALMLFLLRGAGGLLWQLPWVCVVCVTALVSGGRRLLGFPGRLLGATRDTVTCQRCGCLQSLLGRWRCGVCRAVTTTHAWAPCPVCGTKAPAGYIACDTPGCGEAITNPRLRGLS